jgi:hypothetical protein
VDGEVCLTVSVQIELTQSDAAIDRLLEDSSGHGSPMPHYFSRKSGVHRDQLHLLVHPSSNLLTIGCTTRQHVALRYCALDEMLTKRIHLNQLRELRDQIQFSVSKQVIHVT